MDEFCLIPATSDRAPFVKSTGNAEHVDVSGVVAQNQNRSSAVSALSAAIIALVAL